MSDVYERIEYRIQNPRGDQTNDLDKVRGQLYLIELKIDAMMAVAMDAQEYYQASLMKLATAAGEQHI